MSLARSAVRGVGATLAGQWGRFVVQMLSTVVLARLLTPDDYGLVGMVLAITGLAERLKSMGLSTATVQRRTIDQAQLSLLFWINAALGVVVAGLLMAGAPLIARFYGRPELTLIVLVLSTSFIISGLGSQHVALLNRRMQFGSLAFLQIGSIAVGAVLAITAATLGAGYWALVVFHLAQPIVATAIASVRTRWRPSRPGRAEGMRDIVNFGLHLSATEILVYLIRHMDNVLIGRYLGAAQLGVYSKAYQLLLLPMQQLQGPIHRVAVPTLSRLQDDPDRFRRFFRTGLSGAASVVIPLVGLLVVASQEIVLLVLGSQWTAAVPIFRILAVSALATAVGHSNGWLFISLGRVREQMMWGLVANPVILLSFVIGLRWGVRGVATAYTTAMLLLVGPSFWVATRGTPVSIRDIVEAAARPFVVATAATVVAAGVRGTVVGGPHFIVLVITTAAFVAVAGALVAVWPGARSEVVGLLRLARTGVGRAPTGSVPSPGNDTPAPEDQP